MKDRSAFASTARTRLIDQTIGPGVYFRPSVYELFHRDYPQRLIEAGVYTEATFIRGNTVYTSSLNNNNNYDMM